MADKKNTSPAEPVDLSKFDDAVKRMEDGILVPIVSMDGKSPLGFSIKVAGPDSERAQQALNDIQQELIEEGSDQPATSADVALRRMKYFAKVTIDFVPDERPDGTTPDVAVKLDGEPLPYSEENASKLYQRFRFILQQVQLKADTRAAFLNGSPDASAKA